MTHPLQHEYFALRRYCIRHYYSSNFERVDPEWYDQEVASIARLLAHDDRPSDAEVQEIRSKFLACYHHFPFLVEEKP